LPNGIGAEAKQLARGCLSALAAGRRRGGGKSSHGSQAEATCEGGKDGCREAVTVEPKQKRGRRSQRPQEGVHERQRLQLGQQRGRCVSRVVRFRSLGGLGLGCAVGGQAKSVRFLQHARSHAWRCWFFSRVLVCVRANAGAGILALSAGQATGTGWIPSILMCAALGALSSHSFSIVGTACEELNQKDFKVGGVRFLEQASSFSLLRGVSLARAR
jgi:hypothetical protein